MKYRTKLYIALVTTAVVSTLLGLGISYFQVKSFVLREVRDHVSSIAATSAVLLNGDLLKTIQSSQDEQSKNYELLQKQLRAVRDANRRSDVYVKFVYTVVPYAKDSKRFFYQVDAEEATPDFSHYGEEVPDAVDDKIQERLHEVFSPPNYIYNKWGAWLTGFAPVYDSKGHYVATVAADLQVKDVLLKLNQLMGYQLLSFLIVLTLAFISGYFLSRQETLALQRLSEGVEEIGRGKLDTRIHLNAHDEFDHLAENINKMAHGLEERERLMKNFTRYVSQHVMETIIKTKTPVKLEGERRRITVLFSDIRQFTTLSEKLPPETVVALLNEYFAIMVDIIFKNHGMLDKFLGDGMMIEFGVPVDDGRQEFNAVTTALEMQKALINLCDKWEKQGKPRIQIGIGIHSGEVIVGNIGSEKRIEYTAIGDTVNVAARIEQLTKELKRSILISETTVNAIKDQFPFKKIGPVQIRGRDDTITVYSVE